LALASICEWKADIVDVVGAYLNGTLKEQIYMQQIPGYEDGTDSVCLLKRTLYRLQQSRRVWNEKLNEAFLQLGFKRLFADQCVYIWHTDQDLVIVAVHVDNMAIFSSDDAAMAKIKKELAGYFTITDLGELKQIVGMEVERDWEH
jgi:hypothetical protein